MKIDASANQFLLVQDEVIHEPTGAWWKARPNEPTFFSMGMGQLGTALSNGDEYDVKMVEEFALAMLRGRPSPIALLQHVCRILQSM
jgi:hypothetical protein